MPKTNKLKQTKQKSKVVSPHYTPREFADNIMHAASTGDKRFRADLAAVMVEQFRAETERDRVKSDIHFNNVVTKVGKA